MRRTLAVRLHIDCIERPVDALAQFQARHAEVFRPERDIFLDNGRDNLVVRRLEHHADSRPHVEPVRRVASVPLFDPNIPPRRQQQAVQVFCQR